MHGILNGASRCKFLCGFCAGSTPPWWHLSPDCVFLGSCCAVFPGSFLSEIGCCTYVILSERSVCRLGCLAVFWCRVFCCGSRTRTATPMVSFVWVPFRILGGCEIATKVYLSALQIREGGVNKTGQFFRVGLRCLLFTTARRPARGMRWDKRRARMC